MIMTLKVGKSCVLLAELWFVDKAVLNLFELCTEAAIVTVEYQSKTLFKY